MSSASKGSWEALVVAEDELVPGELTAEEVSSDIAGSVHQKFMKERFRLRSGVVLVFMLLMGEPNAPRL